MLLPATGCSFLEMTGSGKRMSAMPLHDLTDYNVFPTCVNTKYWEACSSVGVFDPEGASGSRNLHSGSRYCHL